MDMYKSLEYLNKVASYPVSVKLRDELFLQVSGSKKEGNLVVLIDKCFAIQFDNQNRSMKHAFIKKGTLPGVGDRDHGANEGRSLCAKVAGFSLHAVARESWDASLRDGTESAMAPP